MIVEAVIIGGVFGFFFGLMVPRAGTDRVVGNVVLGIIIGAVVAAVAAAISTGVVK